jgi:hypothetical protein
MSLKGKKVEMNERTFKIKTIFYLGERTVRVFKSFRSKLITYHRTAFMYSIWNLAFSFVLNTG